MTSIDDGRGPFAQNALPLWTPTAEHIHSTNLTGFATLAAARYGGPLLSGSPAENYRELWAWSTARPEDFWSALWEFAQVRGERGDGGGPVGAGAGRHGRPPGRAPVAGLRARLFRGPGRGGGGPGILPGAPAQGAGLYSPHW